MLKKGALLAVLMALGAFAIAGCGGSDDDSSSNSTAADTTEETGGGGGGSTGGGGGGQTLNVSETDFKLDPADPSVNAGEVTIKATNDGQTTHSLEVEGNGIEETELPNDLAPGDSGELTVDLSKPGTYEWYCPIGNHRDLGMEGEITVK
jgi:plastocyanin